MNAGHATALCALVWLAAALDGSSAAQAAGAGERLNVYVVNHPLQYFAQRIGGEHVRVELPVPAGEDPAFWRPGAETVSAYQRADVILLNGAGYAKWTMTATLPRRRLVDTSRGFADALIAAEGVTHSHGSTGAHAHGRFAFTTWLDLNQAAAQAKAIMQALARLRPREQAGFQSRFEALERELRALDSRLLAISRAAPARPLLASHPVYQYLARHYGLNLRSVHWEPDRVPSEGDWASLASLLAEHPAGWMLWEGEPAAATVRRLQDMGVGSLVFDPSANRPAQGDFMSVMRANVENLRRAFP